MRTTALICALSILAVSLTGCQKLDDTPGPLPASESGSSDRIESEGYDPKADGPEPEDEVYIDPVDAVLDELVKAYYLEGYVTYCGVTYPIADYDTQNLHLLEDWIESFRTGEPAVVAIKLNGLGWGSGIYVLRADGTSTYSIQKYTGRAGTGADGLAGGWDDAIRRSATVVKREVDYLFATDLDPATYFAHYGTMTVRHRPMRYEEIAGYDRDRDGPLGQLEPERAAEIARHRYLQFYTWLKQGYHSSFVGGDYFPLDVEPRDFADLTGSAGELVAELDGAITICGKDYYLVLLHDSAASHDGGMARLAVDAERGDSLFSMSYMDGNFAPFADAAQVTITYEGN